LKIHQWLNDWDECEHKGAAPPAPELLRQIAAFYAMLDRNDKSKLWLDAYREMKVITQLTITTGHAQIQMRRP